METPDVSRDSATVEESVAPAPSSAPASADRRNPDRVFAEIVRLASQFDRNIDLPTLRLAYLFASDRHRGRIRMSGDPYILHAVEVARILTDLRLDTQTLAAGLLHDTVEDTSTQWKELEVRFGSDIAQIVDGVTKISMIHLQSREQRHIDSFRKMLLAIAKDVRVLLVKFADRLHNMRTLEYLPPERRVRIARETLDVYAPLAHRFGMARIRRELEDLAFKFVDPEAYGELERLVHQKQEQFRSHIDTLCADVRDGLLSRRMSADVSGRLKHLYSIHRKMEAQAKSVEEIYDLLAVRVIVDTPDQCYDALAYLHQHYRPLEGRFKDYIGSPKSNGYQSLHTTIIDKRGAIVEVQIRTKKMHQVAEEGIARHWLYKEGRSTHDIDSQTRWVRQFLEWAEDIRDPHEFVEQLKIDLFPDEIFVLTPKGDVISLPRGATALDFAFAVHSEVGVHAMVAQVNGAVVPLNAELKTSDSVKIVTSTTQKPSRDWLTMVRTSKARTRIRHWLRNEEFDFNRVLGRDMLDRRLRKAGIQLSDDEWMALAGAFSLKDRDHVYAAVGGNDLTLDRIIDHLRAVLSPQQPSLPTPTTDREQAAPPDVEGGIALSGVDNPMVRFARCCQPVHGDPVLGFITRGRGISVHHRDCPNVKSLMQEPDRFVPVRWEKPDVTSKSGPFRTAIIVKGGDFVGLLNQMTGVIANTGANIRHAEVRTVGKGSQNAFLLEVKNLAQLKRIIAKLRRIPGVVQVSRLATTDDDDDDELRAMISGHPAHFDAGEEE